MVQDSQRVARGAARPLLRCCLVEGAPARKVSQAAMRTLMLCWPSQYAILARLVDLPTPLTPQKTMTYGRPRSCVLGHTAEAAEYSSFEPNMSWTAGDTCACVSNTSRAKPADGWLTTFCHGL